MKNPIALSNNHNNNKKHMHRVQTCKDIKYYTCVFSKMYQVLIYIPLYIIYIDFMIQLIEIE